MWLCATGISDPAAMARKWRENCRNAIASPVILVTAHPIEKLRAATEDIDVVRYMRKPLNLASLADTIASAVA